jgi:hypothetical protein
VTLLSTDGDVGLEPLCALVLDHLLGADGPAWWVDAGGRARTSLLASLAPHDRYLDRIHVARGFTAHQHAALVDRLAGHVDARTTPSALVVAPAVDHCYREGDVDADVAEALLVRRLATLAGLARDHDLAVLLTRTAAGGLGEPVAAAAHRQVTCTATRFGPRFESADGDAETLVYDLGDGWVQTTVAFWREVLAHRARRAESPATAPTLAAPAVHE